MGTEDGEVGTRDTMLHKRDAINRNGNQILDKTRIGYYFYDPLSYVIFSQMAETGSIRES